MEIITKGNLELAVVSYAKLADQIKKTANLKYPLNEGDQLFVAYLGKNPLEFYERIRAPDHKKDAVIRALMVTPPTPDSVMAYRCFLPAHCEQYIKVGLEDIIVCDEQDTPAQCIATTESALGVHLFFHHYSFEPYGEEDEMLLIPDYDEVKSEDVVNHLMENYGTPMLRAYKSNNTYGLESLKHKLSSFGVESPIQSDIAGFCDQFHTGIPLDIPMILAYIDKMSAVVTEDYKRAARLRNFIDKRQAA